MEQEEGEEEEEEVASTLPTPCPVLSPRAGAGQEAQCPLAPLTTCQEAASPAPALVSSPASSPASLLLPSSSSSSHSSQGGPGGARLPSPPLSTPG